MKGSTSSSTNQQDLIFGTSGTSSSIGGLGIISTSNNRGAKIHSPQPRLSFFDHLPRKQQPKSLDAIEASELQQLHPATVKLGGLFAKGIVQTDDDRVTALVAAFCSIVRDYNSPPKKVLREDLDRFISRQVKPTGIIVSFILFPTIAGKFVSIVDFRCNI